MLLVFDLDGTLVDSSRDLASAINAALQRAAPGTAPLPLEAVTRFVGDGARLLVSRAAHHAGVGETPDVLLPIFLDEYSRRLLETTRLYDGVAEALDALSAATLAVLTNKPGGFSRTILEGLGVAGRFARVFGPEDVAERKPDPAGLLRLVTELGHRPETTWMIGDSSIDVETARAAGVRCAGVLWGLHPERLRAASPERLVEHPSQLPSLLLG